MKSYFFLSIEISFTRLAAIQKNIRRFKSDNFLGSVTKRSLG